MAAAAGEGTAEGTRAAVEAANACMALQQNGEAAALLRQVMGGPQGPYQLALGDQAAVHGATLQALLREFEQGEEEHVRGAMRCGTPRCAVLRCAMLCAVPCAVPAAFLGSAPHRLAHPTRAHAPTGCAGGRAPRRRACSLGWAKCCSTRDTPTGGWVDGWAARGAAAARQCGGASESAAGLPPPGVPSALPAPADAAVPAAGA